MLLAVTDPFPGSTSNVNPWAFHAHPEVWLLVLTLAIGYWYVLTKLGPKYAPSNEPIVTRRQLLWYSLGVVSTWVAADWPIHDIAEEYLYSVHMMQHMVLSLIAPALLLLGTPSWMIHTLLVRNKRVYAVTRRVLRPLICAVFYSSVVAFTHWPPVVNNVGRNGAMHFGLHVLVFVSSLMMWFPVLNRADGFKQLQPGVKCIYLFLQSIIPTVPTAYLTFSDKAVYSFYARVPRPFSMSVLDDQQTAAALMRLGGVVILWGSIITIFFRWSSREARVDRDSKIIIQSNKSSADAAGSAGVMTSNKAVL